MIGFKKPFKAVPLKAKRLKGIDELKPLWSPPLTKPSVPWDLNATGVFIGVCLGLAYVFGGW